MSRRWDIAQLEFRAIEMSSNWNVAQLKGRATGRSHNLNVAQINVAQMDVALERSRANGISPGSATVNLV